MKKIVYLAALLICYHAQATLGDAVDFATNTVRAYTKQDNKEYKQYVLAQQEAHPVSALAGEFVKGFVRTASPALLFVAYRIGYSAYHETQISCADLLHIEPHVALLSGAVCLDESIAHGDILASGLKKDMVCNRCLQPLVSNTDRLKEILRIAGSATAVALLIMLTSAKE